MIEGRNSAVTHLLSLLTFVNFEDIFLNVFDGDSADVITSASTHVAESLEVTIFSDET